MAVTVRDLFVFSSDTDLFLFYHLDTVIEIHRCRKRCVWQWHFTSVEWIWGHLRSVLEVMTAALFLEWQSHFNAIVNPLNDHFGNTAVIDIIASNQIQNSGLSIDICVWNIKLQVTCGGGTFFCQNVWIWIFNECESEYLMSVHLNI